MKRRSGYRCNFTVEEQNGYTLLQVEVVFLFLSRVACLNQEHEIEPELVEQKTVSFSLPFRRRDWSLCALVHVILIEVSRCGSSCEYMRFVYLVLT